MLIKRNRACLRNAVFFRRKIKSSELFLMAWSTFSNMVEMAIYSEEPNQKRKRRRRKNIRIDSTLAYIRHVCYAYSHMHTYACRKWSIWGWHCFGEFHWFGNSMDQVNWYFRAFLALSFSITRSISLSLSSVPACHYAKSKQKHFFVSHIKYAHEWILNKFSITKRYSIVHFSAWIREMKVSASASEKQKKRTVSNENFYSWKTLQRSMLKCSNKRSV